jgi:hypothetical protein
MRGAMPPLPNTSSLRGDQLKAEGQLYLCYMELSGLLHVPAALPPGKESVGCWVGSRAVLDMVSKRKIPSPCRESNPGHPARSLVTVPEATNCCHDGHVNLSRPDVQATLGHSKASVDVTRPNTSIPRQEFVTPTDLYEGTESMMHGLSAYVG